MSLLSNLISAALVYASGGVYAAYLAAATFAIGTYGDMDARRRARNARQDYNRGLKDRYAMVKTATEPRQIVYGRARVSGPILFAHSTGSKKEFLHIVVALAGHECDAIESIMLNDVVLPAANATTGLIESGVYAVGKETQKTAAAGSTSGAAFSITLPLAAGETLARVNGVTRHMVYGANAQDAPQSYSLAGNVVSGVTDAGNGSLTVTGINVTYTVGTLSGRVRVRTHLGTATGAQPFAELVAESGGKWTSAHQLNGITAVYLRLEYDQDIFGQTGLPNVSAVVRGKKVRDPATGITAWSDNAALCLADYLRDADRGMGASAAEVPDAEVIAAAAICAQTVAIDLAGTTQARYTCNGVISTDASRRANLDVLAEAMASPAPVWTQGRWLMRAGAHRTAALTITESMLADRAPVIQPWAARRDLVNRIVPKCSAADALYTEVQAPAVENALYLADDGGIDLVQEVTYEMCTDLIRAQRLAKIELERSRQAMVVQLSCNLSAYDLAPSDVVALTLARYGFSAKLFEVVSRSLDVQAWTVDLVLRETAAEVWDWNYGEATVVDLTPNTTLPSPFALPAVLAGLAAASGTTHLQLLADGSIITRALVSWTQSTEIFVTQGGRIEVQWMPADGTVWADAPRVPGDTISTYIGPLQDTGVIYIRARAVNSLGRSSDWAVISHVVVGKSAPPSNVEHFAAQVVAGALLITWDACPDIDYAETELRLGASWAAGTVAYVTRGTLYAWQWPAVGSYTLLAKHRDTSGNESTATASMGLIVNADGTVSLGGADWYTGAGALASWITGTGAAASWASPPVVYLVDTPEIALLAVTTARLADAATTTAKLADAAATTAKLADAAATTQKIAMSAATEVYVAQQASASITALDHIPDGIGFQTTAASVTFTPLSDAGATVDVLASVVFLSSIAASGGDNGVVSYSIQADTFDGWSQVELPSVPSGSTSIESRSRTQRYSLSANVSHTIRLIAKRIYSTTTVTFTNVELRVEVIKR